MATATTASSRPPQLDSDIPSTSMSQKPELQSASDTNESSTPASFSVRSTQTSTQTTISEISTTTESPGTPLHGSKLKHFDKQIPDHLRTRFNDLRHLYSGPLFEALQKRPLMATLRMRKGAKRVNPGDVTMGWKYLGFNETEAELYIVIQCEKAVSKRVKAFFAQRHVTQDLGSDFKLHVIEKSPRRFLSDNGIQVLGESTSRDTLCGMRIRLNLADSSRTTTIGGLIIVSTTEKRLYGLTVGHAISELEEKTQLSAEDSESESSVESDEYSDKEEEISGTDDLTTHVGSISHHSFEAGDTGNYDWALVELAAKDWLPNLFGSPLKLQKSNMAQTQGVFRPRALDLHCPPARSEFSQRSAVVINSSGYHRGALTQKNSSLLMYPGNEFVEIMEFKPDSDSALTYGDSGSWVVDESTGELYGHIVSMDAFGEAFVMPIQSILRNIQSKLIAERVYIPDQMEVKSLQYLNTIQSTTIKDLPSGSESNIPSIVKGVTQEVKIKREKDLEEEELTNDEAETFRKEVLARLVKQDDKNNEDATLIKGVLSSLKELEENQREVLLSLKEQEAKQKSVLRRLQEQEFKQKELVAKLHQHEVEQKQLGAMMAEVMDKLQKQEALQKKEKEKINEELSGLKRKAEEELQRQTAAGNQQGSDTRSFKTARYPAPAHSGGSTFNEYFLPGEGIDREVISADICRYLGNDALVRPGLYENPSGQAIQGYYVSSYRNLTTSMLEDLKADSARWDQEKRANNSRNPSGVQYRTSETHKSRQHYGPSESPYLSNPYQDAGYESSTKYPDTTAPGYSSSANSLYSQQGYPSTGSSSVNSGYYPPQQQQPTPPTSRVPPRRR